VVAADAGRATHRTSTQARGLLSMAGQDAHTAHSTVDTAIRGDWLVVDAANRSATGTELSAWAGTAQTGYAGHTAWPGSASG